MSEGNGQEDGPPVVRDGEGIDSQTREIARVLWSLADEIKEEQSISLLKEIVEKIAHESVHDRSYSILTEYMRKFVNDLGFSVQFSVSKTKEIIKILLVLWNQPYVARYVIQKVYNKDIDAAGTPVDPEMLDQIPSDVKQLDDKAIEIFAKALKDGLEEVKNIRLMVLGMFGVGKTSLVNNLIKDFRDKDIKPLSTEGIDLHRCQLMDNGDWCLDKEHKANKYRHRIKKCLQEVIPSNTSPTVDAPDGPDYMDSVPVEYRPVADDDNVKQHETQSLENIKKNVKERKEDESVKPYIQEIQNEDYTEQVSPEEPKKETAVSVWDFAGQTLYYSTHQFFLNKRSIYLVLMDMTKSLYEDVKEEETSGTWCGLVKDCKYLDVFKFWLNAIHMYSGYQSSTKKLEPTVILVGTRKDEMKGSDEEKENENDSYFEEGLRSFEEGSPILNHIHNRKFLVNNLSPEDPVFSELRDEIKHLAVKQDYWGEKSPIRWIPMEQSLDKMRDEGQQLIKMEKIEEANERNLHPLSGKELTLFLEIQHRHGNILYFNTDELRRLVVLAPQWIIEAFKCFISHVRNKSPTLLTDWGNYTDHAILKPTVFKEIMDKSPAHIGDNREDVIRYMVHLDVMAQPLKLEDVKEARTCAIDDIDAQDEADAIQHYNSKFLDFHIVPCRLKNPPPPITQFTSPTKLRTTPVLCFVFGEKFMPPSFFHRLVAACIRNWPISKELNKYQLYNGLAIFALPSTYTLIIWYEDHIIYARIGSCSTDHTSGLDFKLCQNVRWVLRRSLLNFVHESVENPRNTTAFDEHIQCPEMIMSSHNKGLFRVTAFMYDRELKCTACQQHSVERANAMQYWYKEALDRIDNDDALNTPAEESHLLKASRVIGKEFWLLGIQLGLNDARLNQMYDAPECRKDLRTFVFKYMVTWRKREGEKATVQRLNRAINAARLHCSNDEIIPVIF